MAPAMAERRRGRRKERRRRKGVSERGGRGERGGGIETDDVRREEEEEEEESSRCWTTIALFITPEIAEFTIKIPRSAALMDRRARNARRRLWYFQMNPPLFPPRDASARRRELEEWGRKPAVLPPPRPLAPFSPRMTSTNSAGQPAAPRGDMPRGFDFYMQARFFARSFDRSIAERDARSGLASRMYALCHCV